MFARRRHKLLQQLRKPVGGASSLIEEAEEVALLGQTAGLGSSTSSSNDSIDAGVQMIVKAEALDTPTDDTSSSSEDDISCMERPTPLGAEDS